MTSTEIVKADSQRLCHGCWKHAGQSHWATGVPVFGRLCRTCWEPLRAAMLSVKPASFIGPRTQLESFVIATRPR